MFQTTNQMFLPPDFDPDITSTIVDEDHREGRCLRFGETVTRGIRNTGFVKKRKRWSSLSETMSGGLNLSFPMDLVVPS